MGAPGELTYEPKWDGFRALLFKDGPDVVIQGRGGDDLAYAFPEIVAASRELLPDRIVLDGELVIVGESELDFEALGRRLRPRAEAAGDSIRRLAEGSPAEYVAFDLLALDGDSLMGEPFEARRCALVDALASTARPFHVTPSTDDPVIAAEWFASFEGGGLDGLIVKPLADPYAPGKRTLTKVKHQRTLDAVVAGWRPHSSSPQAVGSLLLGLYDDQQVLHHIGVCSGFSASRRTELAELLAPYETTGNDPHPWLDPLPGTRAPGGVNRWSRGRDSTWMALRPDLVVEVAYDQFEGERLRHIATWQRSRPDRAAGSCTFEQVPRPVPFDIRAVLR